MSWQSALADARLTASTGRMQLLGNDAERALELLRDAYADDLISLEALERVTEDIVHGHPVRLPAGVVRREFRAAMLGVKGQIVASSSGKAPSRAKDWLRDR